MKYWPRLPRAIDRARCLVLIGLTTGALAQTPEADNPLDRFATDVQSLDARFIQELIDADGSVIEREAQGRFLMRRPDEFLWREDSPFEQYSVSNGTLVWHYDVELEQADCAPVSDFADTAALILGGEGRIEDKYDVVELPLLDGRRRFRLKPIDSYNSDFVTATVSFEGSVPVVLEFLDGLEQLRRVRFSDISVNPDFAVDTFVFKAPDDVHIVCDFD